MPKTDTVKYSLDDRQTAEELFVYGGQQLERVSEATGVRISTLKHWSSDDDWKERRLKYRQGQRELKKLLQDLKLKLVKDALKDGADPRGVYALAKLLEMDRGKGKETGADEPQIARPMTEDEAREMVRQEYGIEPENLGS